MEDKDVNLEEDVRGSYPGTILKGGFWTGIEGTPLCFIPLCVPLAEYRWDTLSLATCFSAMDMGKVMECHSQECFRLRFSKLGLNTLCWLDKVNGHIDEVHVARNDG